MAKKKRVYAALSKDFLKRHPWCQHWLHEHGLKEQDVSEFGTVQAPWHQDFLGVVPRSVEIHHMKGREKYFLDTTTWMAVRSGHSTYLHLDPKRYEKGYCLPRN